MRRWLSRADDLLLVAVLAFGGWWGYGQITDDRPREVRAAEVADRPAVALQLLSQLEVKGRAPKTGYSREAFGPRWADVDRNGCDTRNDMLRRDLQEVTLRPGTHGCVVETGVLDDPYTGETVVFQKGSKTSTAVQIDHVVALGDAWQKGAQQWDLDKRTRFANDPGNLLAVGDDVNRKKGASDAASWLPPDRGARCDYVARQVSVKASYGLWVTEAERDQMQRVLEGCRDQAAAIRRP